MTFRCQTEFQKDYMEDLDKKMYDDLLEAAAGGQHWFAFHQDVTPDTMACATRLKLGVSAWSVNEPADMERLARLGVSAIITDRPDLMRDLPEIQN